MPDAPRCLPCLEQGRVGQTYKVAGQPFFKCSTCKTIYHRDRFEIADYLWKDDPARWLVAVKAKQTITSQKGKKRLEQVTTLEGKR